MTATPLPPPSAPPLQFVRRGRLVTLHHVPPTRTLLDLLREDLHSTDTKEGCGEGDCGACTVVLAQPDASDSTRLRYQAVNACIRLAHSIHGLALWTAQDLARDPLLHGRDPASGLHPVQSALVQCHGSQCGFCTPGFAMSLFGLYQQQAGQPISPAAAQVALSGNLCRCTGYRPILDAAQQMQTLPPAQVDEAQVLALLAQIAPQPTEATLRYLAPTDLDALLRLRAAHPGAQIVAGCTDVGLWVTKRHQDFAQVLDVTRVAELRRITAQPGSLRIGAAVSLTDAFAALQAQRPGLRRFFERFAGQPVRNAGTLGGNVANGSPIGDSMPLLIALRAQIELTSVRGPRTLPLEQLYTGYRQNVMAADELLTAITVPLPSPDEWLRAYKISKRQEDDISAVCLVLNLSHVDGQIADASIGVGGVAATPVRAVTTEAALRGQPWNAASFEQAAAVLAAEFNPISDMRASAHYRRTLLAALLRRAGLESQPGAVNVSIDTLELQA